MCASSWSGGRLLAGVDVTRQVGPDALPLGHALVEALDGRQSTQDAIAAAFDLGERQVERREQADVGVAQLEANQRVREWSTQGAGERDKQLTLAPTKKPLLPFFSNSLTKKGR